MKFSTKEDLEIPISATFKMLSDFDTFERMAMRHGADVVRLDDLGAPAVGANWRVTAALRGRSRDFLIKLSEYERPDMMLFDSVSGGMTARFLIELVALSRNRTRMRVELDIKPKTLSARLLLQSARLAKNTLNKRYKTRVSNYAEDIEDRYKSTLRS